jgi:uncharacterized SAM-binding protein YcdF (DUF218 family)
MERTSAHHEDDRPAPARRPRRTRHWPRLLLLGGFLLALVAGLGFVSFAENLPRSEVKISRPADGIVVLTGGASRIADAMELLAEGNGKRLLISGVHPATTPDAIVRINPDYEQLLATRVDLGREATNTIGNALEAGRWAREKRFDSLIVVTSGWHMPRALIEIRHQLPEVRLIPFPVVTERMREDDWWSDAPTVRLLVIEYAKYVASYIRTHLDFALAGAGERERRS